MLDKNKCANPKFKLIVCCQGQPFYYYYDSLIKALYGYYKKYKKYSKYGTMNFTLKQVF